MDEADERTIMELLATYTDLWVRHEMDEWGRLFGEDSDFITHRGIWWRTRRENVVGHQDVPPEVIAQKADYRQEVVSLRAVTPDVVIAHTAWTWPGHRPAEGGSPEDRRGLVTLVLVRRADGWVIEAAQNTRADGLDTVGRAG